MLSKQILLHSLDTIVDPVYITDEQSHFIYVNDTACKVLGYTSKELLGMSVLDIEPSTTPQELEKLRTKTKTPNQNTNVLQTRHKRKNGETFPVEVVFSSINYKDKTFFLSVAHNIAKRKKEQQIVSILQSAMDNANDAIYIIDPSNNGKFLYTNDMATKMLGYSKNEFLNLYIEDIQAQQSSEEFKHPSDLEKLTTYSKHTTKNGDILDVKISVSTFMYENTPFHIILVKDINEQQKMESKLLQSKDEYYSLSENIPMYIVRWDNKGRYIYLNKTLEKTLGVKLEDIKGRKFKDVLGDKFTELQQAFYQVLKTKQMVSLERVAVPIVDKDDEIHSVNIVPEFDQNGNVKSVLVAGWNMTNTYILQDSLATKEQEFRTLVETAPGMIGSIYVQPDLSAYIPYVSPNIYELYGITPQDVKESINPLLELHHPADVARITKDIFKSIRQMQTWNGQYRIKHPSLGERWLQCTFKPNPQPNGAVIFHGFVLDITEQKENEKQKEFLAFYDPLTKLPNRILTADRIKQAIAQAKREHSMFAIFFIDLDNFKTINDSIGHHTGDKVIQAVAKRLTTNLRQNDTISRHGGDEFLLIATNISSIGHITKVAKKIIDLFQEPFYADNYTFSISASIGISIYPDTSKDYDTLLKEADLAMYKAKERGKNTFELSQIGSSLNLLKQLEIQNEISLGIQNKEFELYYQPQVEIASNKVIGVEALIRWNSKKFGFLTPDKFISIAETSGHIIELSEWIIQEACDQGALWHKNGKKLNIAINISAIQFQRGDLITTITKSLLNSQFDPKYLELEITESIMMNNAENALANISVLKGLGVQLSIDDFGTGYSSLSYLKRFDVDKLKIDRSFIMNILHDKDDKVIVKSIIKMAKSLGLRTIAEGVEDKKTAELLQKLDCDEIQGYFYAKPMSVKNFQKYCKKMKECIKD